MSVYRAVEKPNENQAVVVNPPADKSSTSQQVRDMPNRGEERTQELPSLRDELFTVPDWEQVFPGSDTSRRGGVEVTLPPVGLYAVTEPAEEPEEKNESSNIEQQAPKKVGDPVPKNVFRPQYPDRSQPLRFRGSNHPSANSHPAERGSRSPRHAGRKRRTLGSLFRRNRNPQHLQADGTSNSQTPSPYGSTAQNADPTLGNSSGARSHVAGWGRIKNLVGYQTGPDSPFTGQGGADLDPLVAQAIARQQAERMTDLFSAALMLMGVFFVFVGAWIVFGFGTGMLATGGILLFLGFWTSMDNHRKNTPAPRPEQQTQVRVPMR